MNKIEDTGLKYEDGTTVYGEKTQDNEYGTVWNLGTTTSRIITCLRCGWRHHFEDKEPSRCSKCDKPFSLWEMFKDWIRSFKQ